VSERSGHLGPLHRLGNRQQAERAPQSVARFHDPVGCDQGIRLSSEKRQPSFVVLGPVRQQA
jgi:hypothetical protein